MQARNCQHTGAALCAGKGEPPSRDDEGPCDALKCISSYIGGKIWKFQEPLVRQQHTPTEPELLCVNNGIKIHAALSIPRHEPQTRTLPTDAERRRSFTFFQHRHIFATACQHQRAYFNSHKTK